MSKGRLSFVILFIALVAIAIISKLVLMNTAEHKFLARQGADRVERIVQEHAYRGSIVDRNGSPLAVSTPVDSLWVNPLNVKPKSQNFKKVLKMLDLSKAQQAKIIKRINKRLGRSGFVYLKRKVNPQIATEIANMEVLGVHLKREYKRYYPTGEVTSQVVGFTNVDNKGQEGMELMYNSWLDGEGGQQKIWRDAKGYHAVKLGKGKASKNGNDMALSIDRKIQYIAYKALKEGVVKNNAMAGSVVVMDVKTGEILAMANQPSYNPNNMKTATPEKRRNRAVTDVFEPGSVMKTFSAVTGLKSGEYTPESIVKTSPGYYRVGGKTVRDFRNYGDMNLGYILLKSSNVGISKVILSLPHEMLPNTMREFGFGQTSGVEFPGERSGYVPMPRKWGEFPLATLSFGYGMNLTALQLARGYAALGNHGKLVKPTFIRKNKGEKIEALQVIDHEVADQVLAMLENVVEGKGGTGAKAKIWGYHMAGKTGTTRKAIKGGYATDDYMAVFSGLAPATNPKLVVVVVVDGPKGESYGGGSVSAPIVAKIMAQSLKVLGVRPDKV
ncbi:penicillin-binding protein 2 [Francisellaceae bacterium]|nr:penicillin-binding protein 2 [Francisellaceae bacterium]